MCVYCSLSMCVYIYMYVCRYVCVFICICVYVFVKILKNFKKKLEFQKNNSKNNNFFKKIKNRTHGNWDGEEHHGVWFSSCPTKSIFFHFWRAEIVYLFKAATETWNQKLGTTPHINNRHPRIHISAFVSLRHPLEIYFGFCKSSYWFRWNRGGFAL
jgi:hypothetical protein